MGIIRTIPNKAGDAIQVADVPVIDYGHLLAGSSDAAELLLAAARSDGFLQLNLSSTPEGRSVLNEVETMYALGYRYFDQPQAVKEKDIREQPSFADRGYKYCASDETLEINRDELRAGNPSMPTVLEDSRTRLTVFMEGCHNLLYALLDSLSASSGLAKMASGGGYHDVTASSESGLKFVNEPTIARQAEVVENLHTDGGTFTLLFSKEWGLHAYLPSQSQWAFVPPRDGCALISVADSLSKLSRQQFHSPQHRVTQCEDGAGPRMYLSYFLRPTQALKASICP